MRLRLMIGKYPIFSYCAICTQTVFYPLSRLLFKTNLCWQHGFPLSWPHWESQISRRLKLLSCYLGKHHWACDGGFLSTDGRENGNTYLCGVCFKRKYTWVSLKVAIKRKEVADKIALTLVLQSEGGKDGEVFQSKGNGAEAIAEKPRS